MNEKELNKQTQNSQVNSIEIIRSIQKLFLKQNKQSSSSKRKSEEQTSSEGRQSICRYAKKKRYAT